MPPGPRTERADRLSSASGDLDPRRRERLLLDTAPRHWPDRLARVGDARLLRAAVAVVTRLAMPVWREGRPHDVRPDRALEATQRVLANRSDDAVEFAKVAAKGCSAARRDSLGHEHRVAEAARALAVAATRLERGTSRSSVGEGLEAVESSLAYEYAIEGVYDRGPRIRAAMLAVLLEGCKRRPAP